MTKPVGASRLYNKLLPFARTPSELSFAVAIARRNGFSRVDIMRLVDYIAGQDGRADMMTQNYVPASLPGADTILGKNQ